MDLVDCSIVKIEEIEMSEPAWEEGPSESFMEDGQDEAGDIPPYEPPDSSDVENTEESSEESGEDSSSSYSSSSSSSLRRQSPTRGRGRRGAAAAARDDCRSQSPHRNEAWKTEEDPDTAVPPPLRFIPRREPGVQPPLTFGNQTPVDIFSLFFDAEVLVLLCLNTNKYAKRSLKMGKKFVWTSLDPHELRKYLGMLLFMSVCRLPKMSDYWRRKSIFHLPFPASVMTRDRFTAITCNLHISDPEEDAVNEQKKRTKDYDPVQQVKTLLSLIRDRSKTVYHPRQHISVDERVIATKARLKIKQCLKAKPTKSGLKFFVLADVNGYTVDYRMYTGKNQEASGNGLSFDMVMDLVNKDYLGSGYIVYCNNYFTSPLLFRHLKKQGHGACGTYRQCRYGVPTTPVNALNKKSKRGSIRWIRDGDLLYVKWMDSREVSLCTTVHPAHTGDTVLRWKKTNDGHLERVPVPRPTAVAEYNKYIGGVYTSDQMLATNSVHRKSGRWPMTVFQHLLDIAATNSFIIHKELSMMKQEKPMTRQAFQEQLCAELLRVSPAGLPRNPTQGHFPIPTNKRHCTERRQKASLGRKQCTVCKKSTPWMCEDCKVGLCLQLGRNCFREYHTQSKT